MDDLEKCSVRRLKYLCEEKGIAIPLVPTRSELITALRGSTQRSQGPSPVSRKNYVSENFETPKVPITATSDLTPIYDSQSTRMRLQAARAQGISPSISGRFVEADVINRHNRNGIRNVVIFTIVFIMIFVLVYLFSK